MNAVGVPETDPPRDCWELLLWFLHPLLAPPTPMSISISTGWAFSKVDLEVQLCFEPLLWIQGHMKTCTGHCGVDERQLDVDVVIDGRQ